MSLDPDMIYPRPGLLLVTRYKRPEKIGSIFVNPAWDADMNCSLWEVIRSNSEQVAEGSLLITRPHRGIFVTRWEGQDYFIIADHQVEAILPVDNDEAVA